MPRQEVSRYGIIAHHRMNGGLHRVDDLVEKPAPEQAPSLYAVIGRYVLTPDIFPILRRISPGKNGEIQLTDALRVLAKRRPMFAVEIEGQRHDAGEKLGFLKATVEFALKNPTLGPPFAQYLRQLRRRNGSLLEASR